MHLPRTAKSSHQPNIASTINCSFQAIPNTLLIVTIFIFNHNHCFFAIHLQPARRLRSCWKLIFVLSGRLRSHDSWIALHLNTGKIYSRSNLWIRIVKRCKYFVNMGSRVFQVSFHFTNYPPTCIWRIRKPGPHFPMAYFSGHDFHSTLTVWPINP